MLAWVVVSPRSSGRLCFARPRFGQEISDYVRGDRVTRVRDCDGGERLTLTAPMTPNILALAASALYVSAKRAREGSEPGRIEDIARRMCVQNVRVGSTMARNLRRVSRALKESCR